MERLTGLLDTHGGEVVCGGQYSKEDKYIAPTIIIVNKDSPIMAEETFGPIILVSYGIVWYGMAWYGIRIGWGHISAI